MILSLGVLACLLVALVACEKQVRVPASAYSGLDEQGALKWEVTTKDKSYRSERLTVTDSSMVLLNALWVKDRKSGSYQSSVWDRVDRSELPIVLPLNQVESVDRVEEAKGRTIAAKTTVAVIVVGGITLLILYFSTAPWMGE